MKKIVFLMFILVISICIFENKNELLIPSNAVRIRIIANSNDINDQKQKYEIKKEVTEYLYKELENVDNYQDANNIINLSINNVEKIINKYTSDYDVSFGSNYFPKKEYKGISYDEGKYESLVIKLGKGEGNNFWCVLFPPLCMIDEKKLDDTTYKFYISEILNRFKEHNIK